MKKLVIGGSGFVGSILSEQLLERGYDVIVFDNMKYGSKKNIKDLNVKLIYGDIFEPEILREYMDDVDTVYFLSTVNIIAGEENYSECINTNIYGLNKVLEIIKNYKHIKRFVYTSTSSIYGNNEKITEDSVKKFMNIYSTTKYAGECISELYYNTENVPLTVIRYTNVYGRNQRPESKYSGVIIKFIESALKGEDIIITGDGNQSRDFIHVEDVARLTIDLSEMDNTIGKSINIGSGNSCTISYVANIVKELCDSDSKIIRTDKRKIDNILYRKLDIRYLESFINTDLKYNLRTGIKDTIKWYKENYEI